jgi:hypothetical protein
VFRIEIDGMTIDIGDGCNAEPGCPAIPAGNCRPGWRTVTVPPWWYHASMRARRRAALLTIALLAGSCDRKHDGPPPESVPGPAPMPMPAPNPAQVKGPAPAPNGTQGVNLVGGAAVDISFVPDPPVSGQPFTVRLTTSEDQTAHRVLTTRVQVALSEDVSHSGEWMDMTKAEERSASPDSPAAFLYLAKLTAPNKPAFVHVYVQWQTGSQSIAFRLNVDARAVPVATAPVIPSGPATDVEINALIDRIDNSNAKDREAATELKQRLRHEQMSLVIDRWRLGYPSPGDVLLDALEQVVTVDDRAFIVGKYPDKIGLIRFIQKFHWERDVKEKLVDQLSKSSGYLPAGCVEALAELRDPSTYPALKSYFLNGWNRHSTYKVISTLPGMDLRRELPKAWDAAMSSSNRIEAAYLIGPVLDLGYLPALEMVMNELREPSGIPSTILDPALVSSRYLDFSGTAQERLRFWDEHRKELRYDAARKKFTLAK